MSDVKKFVVGIAGLDKLLGEITAPYTLLIGGHPGAGKTTFATAICYANALQGRKCLYMTFYENKEKLFKFMKRLGFDLESLERKGLYSFVNLPQTLDVEMVVSEISRLVAEGYEIIVIDSITALLEPIKGDAAKRAWLLNYFYQLQNLVNGLVILIAELPFGEERLGLGSVEFVADGVVLLKHRVEDGFLTRLVEVRKARGSPIHIAETYFTMAEGIGVRVFAPPLLEEIPPEKEETLIYDVPGWFLRLRRGYVLNFFHPPEPELGIDFLIHSIAVALRMREDAKLLVISYTRPASVLRRAVKRRLAKFGLSEEKVDKLLDKHVTIVALNPYAHSLTQLVARELTIIEQHKPDTVFFWGAHIPRATYNYALWLKELFNELMYLKSKGIIVVRSGPCINKQACDAEASLSDVVVKYVRTFKGGVMDVKFYMYERFKGLTGVVPASGIDEFTRRCAEALKAYIEKL
jgi:circadian clock protein KaiC